MRVRAPAKVNLTLAVLGKRPDGFHEVDTWMLALELADELELTRTREPGVLVELAGPFASADIPADATNLAARAAQAAIDLSGAGEGIALRLVKHIPSGSGLGGGSADAAAAWTGACALLGLDPASAAGEHALASLGSDCVFFWKAAGTGYARCLGRGERVEPAPAPPSPRWISLVVPDVSCPTGKVYAAFAGRSGLANDLEPAALAAVPDLRPWRKALDSCSGTRWQLSGSGSAFFARYEERGEAQTGLDAALQALGQAGLRPRGTWVSAVAGRGARILPVG